jgi:hypothetical protein
MLYQAGCLLSHADTAVQFSLHAAGTLNKGDVLAQLAVTLSSQHGKGLLLFVMESAQRISLDSRPEVRTSGIKLLFDIMTRHGVVLLGDEGRVWDMAFPLLMEVAKNVLLSDEAHAQSAPGSSVQVWLSHLRRLVRPWLSQECSHRTVVF